MVKSRQIVVKSYPEGTPTKDNFELKTVELDDLKDGELLIKSLYISVDPYMRGLMTKTGTDYAKPIPVGSPMTGSIVGVVEESKNKDFEKGQIVSGQLGWNEFIVSDGSGLQKKDKSVPLSWYLGAVGATGLTAYGGLFFLDLKPPQKGETVFVSGAAGAVGSVVCQIAKIVGARVIGSAGSAAKCDWLLNELKIDDVINYKETSDLTKTLREKCPDGLDFYFDNVGSTHLEAALEVLNVHGRISACGMIATYNKAMPGPPNLSRIITKRLHLQGLLVVDFFPRAGEFAKQMGEWIKEGKIKNEETIVEGFENIPDAFIGLFSGKNQGKMVVKV
mmetsp:Transcript_4312/g.7003  ORF Transcript_4312/g.7003 Transcript_4312/m.7003 type:complete len:334 (+) Transcript_4312:72-1073(+)